MQGNLSPFYRLRMHNIETLRSRFSKGSIDEVAFRTGLYGIGYAPGEVQREVEENRPFQSLGEITKRVLES